MRKVKRLNTKLTAYAEGRKIEFDYNCHLEKNEGVNDKWLFVVEPPVEDCHTTARWSWYLSTLLDRHYAAPNDVLSLEWDQQWYVKGVIAALREALIYI